MVPPTSSPGSSIPIESDAREVARVTAEKHRRPALSRTIAEDGLGPYRGYCELLDAIERLGEKGARLKEIGRSVRGEPLFSVTFGSEDPKARTSAVLSCVHPIEWIGIEACLSLLERLASADLGDRMVVAFPIVNPDGLLRVEDALRTHKRRWVRHNARGVDLNRNFDAHWGQRGWFQRALSWIFSSGTAAASEPEVAAISYELSERRVDRALSLHSFGGAVLFPPAHTVWPIRDYAEHRAWAKAIAKQARNKPYSALPCSWFAMGTTQSGLEIDWFHERHGALSILVECEGGPSLPLPRMIHPFAWFNPLDLSRVAPQVAGAVLPFVTGETLAQAQSR